MSKKNSNFSRTISWIFTVLAIIALIKACQIYKKHYFEDFIRAESQMNISKFYRDSEVKYSEMDSYVIESPDYNDTLFYKEVNVKPNTAYRVTCMVKTKNVEQEKIPAEATDAGAMICLLDTTEVSENIIGTNDWTKLTFIFDSENRSTVKIGFRLGGNLGNCKGTAWFSDFKLEEGIRTKNDSEWKIGCFIFKNINIDEKLNISMDAYDIENIKSNMERFAESCQILSENKIKIKYDIYEIEEPITTLTYSEEYKYHVAPQDVKDTITNTVINNEYDHVFAVIRMGDSNNGIEVNVGDWIGLRRYGTI